MVFRRILKFKRCVNKSLQGAPLFFVSFLLEGANNGHKEESSRG